MLKFKTTSEHQSLSTYFQNEGLSKKILDFFNVKVENIHSKEPEIHYPYLDGSIKICRPFSTEKWKIDDQRRNENKPRVFGYNQLPEKGKFIIISAGEKDTMSLYSLGLAAICFSSETVSFNQKLLEELKERFEEIVILYDLDKTGNDQSLKLSEKFDIPYANLKKGAFGKDVTDFLSSGGSKSDIECIIKKGISRFYRTKTSYPAKLLQKMEFMEDDYIIPGILSNQSLGAIVGGSDTGKSLLALQFAISYTINRELFGSPVKGGKNVLYFSLEDSQETISRRFKKLSTVLTSDDLNQVESKLHFKHVKGNIVEEIDEYLINYPETGLIIIDTFSDLMAGRDLNSAGHVREILNPLHEISIKHDTFTLFIHHLNKTSEKEHGFGKLGIVGSQSFEAKMRVIFQMNKKTSKLGKLEISIGIIKGNDINDSLKKSSSKIKLDFCKDTLWYTKSEDQNELDIEPEGCEKTIDWSLIFGNYEFRTTEELRLKLMEIYRIKDKTAEKWIQQDLREFRVSKGNYRNPSFQEEALDEDFIL